MTQRPRSGAIREQSGERGEASLRFALEAAALLAADKCENVVLLDVRRKSQVTDYVLIGSGTSDRQMNSALDDTQDLGESLGYTAFRTSRDDRSTWLLADFVNVVVHLFEPNTRAYYDLEMLWGDAPRVDWRAARDAGSANGDGRR